MDNLLAKRLAGQYPLISEQIDKKELEVILTLCQAAIEKSGGEVVELGCYTGTTSIFLARLLKELRSKRTLHVYDSFEGLPPKTMHDSSPAGAQFKTGQLKASKTVLLHHFKRAGLPLPSIHKGWFSDLNSDDLPDHIAFAFLDGDYYQSLMDSFKLVWPKLGPGAIVVVDDYHNEALPGAKQAVDTWLARHPATLTVNASLAIIAHKKRG